MFKHFNEINDRMTWKEQAEIRYNEKLQQFYTENDPWFTNEKMVLNRNFSSVGYEAFGEGNDKLQLKNLASLVHESKRMEMNPTMDGLTGTFANPDEMVARHKVISRQQAYNDKNHDQILALLRVKPEFISDPNQK